MKEEIITLLIGSVVGGLLAWMVTIMIMQDNYLDDHCEKTELVAEGNRAIYDCSGQ